MGEPVVVPISSKFLPKYRQDPNVGIDFQNESNERDPNIRSSLKQWPTSSHNPLLSVSQDRIPNSFVNQSVSLQGRPMSGKSYNNMKYKRDETPTTPEYAFEETPQMFKQEVA